MHLFICRGDSDKFWATASADTTTDLTPAYLLEPFEPVFLVHGEPPVCLSNYSLCVFPSNLYLG